MGKINKKEVAYVIAKEVVACGAGLMAEKAAAPIICAAFDMVFPGTGKVLKVIKFTGEVIVDAAVGCGVGTFVEESFDTCSTCIKIAKANRKAKKNIVDLDKQ